MQILDISAIPRNGKLYNGTTKKYGVTINGINCIVKCTKANDMSVYSEYIASNLITSLGYKCHAVRLARLNGEIVNLIKDFTTGTNYSLHSYKDTKQSSEDTNIGNKEYTYDDILHLMDKHLKMTDQNKEKAKHAFWQMFICDAIIGNRDRHWGNWGYLRANTDKSYIFAPLYDNGAGLFPGISKKISEYYNIRTRKKFMYDRVYVFPASLFKIQRPDRTYRSNYAEMFKDLRINKIFAEEVANIKSKFRADQMFYIAYTICKDLPLDQLYKRFYIEIITLRYMCIILRNDFNESYKIVEEALTRYGY